MDAVTRAIQRGEGQEMGRLIDADLMAVNESEAYMKAQLKCDGLNRMVNEVVHKKIQMLILDTPTVDAVEVVRCGECRKWLPDSTCHTLINGKKHPIGCCQHTRRFTADCGFCSYGERR